MAASTQSVHFPSSCSSSSGGFRPSEDARHVSFPDSPASLLGGVTETWLFLLQKASQGFLLFSVVQIRAWRYLPTGLAVPISFPSDLLCCGPKGNHCHKKPKYDSFHKVTVASYCHPSTSEFLGKTSGLTGAWSESTRYDSDGVRPQRFRYWELGP